MRQRCCCPSSLGFPLPLLAGRGRWPAGEPRSGRPACGPGPGAYCTSPAPPLGAGAGQWVTWGNQRGLSCLEGSNWGRLFLTRLKAWTLSGDTRVRMTRSIHISSDQYSLIFERPSSPLAPQPYPCALDEKNECGKIGCGKTLRLICFLKYITLYSN